MIRSLSRMNHLEKTKSKVHTLASRILLPTCLLVMDRRYMIPHRVWDGYMA